MKRPEPAWLCEDCGTVTTDSDLLSAPHPFPGAGAGDRIFGCPVCHGVTHVLACDEEGCDMEQTCGTPTAEGYRTTCYDHAPWSLPVRAGREEG